MKKHTFYRISSIILACLIITSIFGGFSSNVYAVTFDIGDTVAVITNLNVRTGPSTSYPEITDPEYPGYAPTGTQGQVVDGPIGADGYIWWKVNYGPGLYSGWSVEDYLEKVITCPYSCWDVSPLSSSELANVVRSHFPLGGVAQTGESIRVTAYAITKAESGGNPSACGDSNRSIGLWQINIDYHPEYDKCLLFEEDYNANAAKEISSNGNDWNSWCTWEETACGGNGNESYKNYLLEARKHFYPQVTSLSVSQTSINSGEEVKVNYSVSNDVGLDRVELWRTTDNNGNPDPSLWEEIKRVSVFGTSYSGYISDIPTSSGIYWYGIHVSDNSGAPEAWNDEKNSRTGSLPGDFGPIMVEVKSSQQPGVLVAYIEGRIDPSQEWFHWGTLYTDETELSLELRGTESQNRSNVQIVRYEWDFGDGDTAEGEYTSHTYTTGYYDITLTVYDEAGNSALETLRIEVRGGVSYNSLDFLKYNPGTGIKYHVTDNGYTLDVNVWAVSQYVEAGKPHDLDFVYTLVKERTGGSFYRNSTLGGQIDRDISGKSLTMFYAGYPVGNQANFYYSFSLPRYFNSGDHWNTWDNKSYFVEYVGSQTVGSIVFDQCIKITIDDSQNENEYLRGTGYFILARNIGIVKIVFNRSNGSTVIYEYVTHTQLSKHTLSGTVRYSDAPVEGIAVQIANADWGTRSITDPQGSFSIQAYGPDVVLRLGYDQNNDYVFDFTSWEPEEYTVNNVSSDISGLVVNLQKTPLLNELVVFPDPNLEAAIRQAINKATGPIYASDLIGLEGLTAEARDISNLSGLEYCHNLVYLNLWGNPISDLSVLEDLVNLQSLLLYSDQISDISALGNLINLKFLYLVGDQVRDVSIVGNLVNLRDLTLSGSQINNVSVVAALINLERLWLSANSITDMSFLASLTNLRNLVLYDCQASDISVLAFLGNLEGLFLLNGNVSDLSPLATLTNLKRLSLQRQPISDISVVANLINLEAIYIGQCPVSNISDLANLSRLQEVTLRYDQISDISPLVANNGISSGDTVDLRGNPLSPDSINIYIPQLQARGVSVYYDMPSTPAITRAWASEIIRGPAVTEFPTETEKIYVNYEYENPIGTIQKIIYYDDKGNMLGSHEHVSEHISGTGTWGLTYPGEESWPLGFYRAELFMNDVLLANISWGVSPGYAIIVAGQGEWWKPGDKHAIDHAANNAYRVLQNLGFDDNHIFYLNSNRPQNIDNEPGDEVDKSASVSIFEDVIDEVRDQIRDNPVPLVLYLVGHGVRDAFILEGGDIPVSKLQDMLGEFSSKIRMLIVISSCYSGSFIIPKYPAQSISSENRIIITATHGDLPWGLIGFPTMVRFSDRFWGNLNEGLNIREAFIHRAWPTEIPYLLLDDNGDKKGHSLNNLEDDGEFAAATTIGLPGTEDLELTQWIQLRFHSSGELRVYDSQNRVTGLVNGEVKVGIPNSMYDDVDESVAIFFPSDVYRYEVLGTKEGTYGLDIAFIEGGEATIFSATDIPTTGGAIQDYTIDWEVLSQGGEGVTVQVDYDGDGEFEETITTDNKLTGDEFILQTNTLIDFDPDTLNLKSKGKFVTVYIELPEGYDIGQIDISTILLNDSVSPLAKPIEIGDYDKDGITDLMVKFDRAAVQGMLTLGEQVEITISGEVAGIVFEGHDNIRVRNN